MIKTLLANKIFILFLMLFFHVLEDFHLQGILASMKQKEWWETQVGSKDLGKYKCDWIVALLVHSFEWSFMIMLPLLLYPSLNVVENNAGFAFTITILVCTIIHFVVDDAKCNKKHINLVIDQTAHILQILVVWFVFTYRG